MTANGLTSSVSGSWSSARDMVVGYDQESDGSVRSGSDQATLPTFALRDCIVLGSVNACSVTVSSLYECRLSEDLWITHVVLVYNSIAERDPSLTFADA